MSGLRAKHKADRDGRIVEAAAELFREAGYEGAKIEAIAAAAEVSVGTIYNYYQNKGDILVAIVSMEVNEVLNAGRGVVAEPPRNVGDAIDTLIGIYIEHSLNYLSKEMWRQAMAISTQQPDSPFGRTYTGLDRALTDQICALIGRLQELGLVRADIDGARGRRAAVQQHEHDVHRIRETRRRRRSPNCAARSAVRTGCWSMPYRLEQSRHVDVPRAGAAGIAAGGSQR